MACLRERDVTAAVFVHDVEHVADFRYYRLELLRFVRARYVFVLFRLLDRAFNLQQARYHAADTFWRRLPLQNIIQQKPSARNPSQIL